MNSIDIKNIAGDPRNARRTRALANITRVMWVKATSSLPEADEVVRCKVQHSGTKSVQEIKLRKVTESGCAWRTTGFNSPLHYDWTVVEWLPNCASGQGGPV